MPRSCVSWSASVCSSAWTGSGWTTSVEEFNDDRIKTLENIKKLPCYSAESFVTHTDIKDDVLFDMELNSIYIICCMCKIDLISLKKVSDNLSLDDYYKNIDMKEVMELTSGLELLRGEL